MSTCLPGHARRLSPHQGGKLFITGYRRAAGLSKIAETLSNTGYRATEPGSGRALAYTCVCFALDFANRSAAGSVTITPTIRSEYRRNLVFEVGGHMEQCFIAHRPQPCRTRSQDHQNLLGYNHRPKNAVDKRLPNGIALRDSTYDLRSSSCTAASCSEDRIPNANACCIGRPCP